MKPEQVPRDSEEAIELVKEVPEAGIPIFDEEPKPQTPQLAAGGNKPPNTPPILVGSGGADDEGDGDREKDGSSLVGVPASEDAGETVIAEPIFEIGPGEVVEQPVEVAVALVEDSEPRATRRENLFLGGVAGLVSAAACLGIATVIIGMTGAHHF